MGSCVHHDGFLYDNSESDLKIYTPSETAISLGKLEHQAINNATMHVEFEWKKRAFKWICYDDTFTVGRSSGCKRGKHGFFVLDNNQSNENITNNKMNRMTQATVEEWEEAWRDNKEYA
ncbi:unnamed protein product [Didymodactylos carnosus]|uniref:Uncharacterized protein n=1 Tax=Didymodactylos carnosus TaxID=1234261 RepID=A0A815FRQ6_9BILA|nr:unnamed protein product [Didymodactylos carnosus]CAF1330351.1 unnamed protein product [Didymodactylos carnosus]CAF4042739.1 unnamed protein product [Didymodactylos carnosus]CAF4183317.1 unnamed protein product [Didymodactylos carnosus]